MSDLRIAMLRILKKLILSQLSFFLFFKNFKRISLTFFLEYGIITISTRRKKGIPSIGDQNSRRNNKKSTLSHG